jgi:hypothetical protein
VLFATIWPVLLCGMPWAISIFYHLLCLSWEFDSFLNRKHTLGALSFHRSVARPEPSTPSSSSEAAQVEASSSLTLICTESYHG